MVVHEEYDTNRVIHTSFDVFALGKGSYVIKFANNLFDYVLSFYFYIYCT